MSCPATWEQLCHYPGGCDAQHNLPLSTEMTAETVVEKGLASTSWAMEEEGTRGLLLLRVLLMALNRSNNCIKAGNLLLIQLLPHRVKQCLLLFSIVISLFSHSFISRY